MANQLDTSGQGRKNSKRKWIFLSLGLLATGLSLFGYHYWKKNKQTTQSDGSAPDFKAEKPKTSTTSAPKAPAKKPTGKQPGPTAKAKTKTKTSLKPGPTSAKPKAAKPIDASAIAKNIHAAVLKKDFSKVYEQLKNIKSTKDYSAVSKVFSTMIVMGVRRTLVDGLLTSFQDAKQRDTLGKSFRAMGLKFNDKTKKWALSGPEQSLIITTNPTKVWKDPKTAVPVPANMVLGGKVCQRGTFTLFENDRQYFLVETKSIKPFSSK